MLLEREAPSSPDTQQFGNLTAHEVDMLSLVATGRTSAEIGLSLSRRITHGTVKNILSASVFKKLGAPNITATVVCALKLNYFDYQSVQVRMTSLEGDTPQNTLTARQREILLLTARGLSGKQIARELKISKSTVKNHFNHRVKDDKYSGIYERLGIVSSQTAAVVRALQLGIFSLEEI